MGIFPTSADDEALFENMGEDGVRLYLQHGPNWFSISGQLRRLHAIRWLTKYDYEARKRIESSQAESLEIAKLAKDAAWSAAEAARLAASEAAKANVIATAALIVAVIAIAASIVAAFVKN